MRSKPTAKNPSTMNDSESTIRAENQVADVVVTLTHEAPEDSTPDYHEQVQAHLNDVLAKIVERMKYDNL
jgi:hypothetical protein